MRAGDGTPTMVYDIPGRAGIQIAEDTYVELVKNPLVVAVKDAVGDFERGAWLLRETGIRIYSGDDALTLPWLSIGASGVVGVTTHVAGDAYADMVRAFDAGDMARAQETQPRTGAGRARDHGPDAGRDRGQGGHGLLGVIPNSDVRLPLTGATDAQVAVIRAALVDFGLLEN